MYFTKAEGEGKMSAKSMAAVICSATALVVLAYSACSRVTIVGDKDKPIPINADIKIHIYQHAANDVDKMLEGLEEAEEPEEASSNETAAVTVLIRVIEAVSVQSAYAAEAPSDPLCAVTSIYPTVVVYMKKGLLGEGHDGYVVPLNKATNAAPTEVTAATKAADALNTARRKLYENRAKKEGTDIRTIQATYAQVLREKSPKGVWIEVQQNNTWVWKQK